MNESQPIKFLVRVSCATYNHAAYIVDTLNGFTMQETNFPFVCTIIDDASTDGEPEVIRQYLRENFDLDDNSIVRNEETDDYLLTFARHNTNMNCYFAVLFLKYNHYSIKKSKVPYISEWSDNVKYIAVCEGDDYWTHPLKLQMQVDFMEKHEDHSLCLTHYNDYWSDDRIVERGFYPQSIEVCPIKDIIENCNFFFGTATMLWRADLLKPEDNPFWNKNLPIGDIPTLLILASRGKVCYLVDNTSNYRRLSVGSWSQRFEKSHKKLYELHKSLVRMWKGFNEWTQFRYNEYVLPIIKKEKRLMIQEVFKFVIRIFIPIKMKTRK